jgi:hypothetical protein
MSILLHYHQNKMCDLPVMKLPLVGKHGAGKFALVDGDYDGEYLSQYRWYYEPHNGYAYTMIQHGQSKPRHREKVYLHHLAGGMPPRGMWTDHKNRIKLDCRSCNLRWVSPSRSALNRRYTTGKTGYRGVHRNASIVNGKRYVSSKWSAVCQSRYIGSYPTAEEAAKAYDEKANQLWGPDAVLNFPDG